MRNQKRTIWKNPYCLWPVEADMKQVNAPPASSKSLVLSISQRIEAGEAGKTHIVNTIGEFLEFGSLLNSKLIILMCVTVDLPASPASHI